jgi:hypothetical protein
MFYSGLSLVPALRVEFGHRTPGTFTAQRLDCRPDNSFGRGPHKPICSWHGEFVSTDGRIRRDDVTLPVADKSDLQEGGAVRVVDIGDSREVFRPGSHRWVMILGFMLLFGMIPVISALSLFRAPSRTEVKLRE